MSLPITKDNRLYVIWRMGSVTSPFNGEPRFVQHTPTFKSITSSPDAILVYSDYHEMLDVLRELSADPAWRDFLDGYDPGDYVKDFSVLSVAELWDAHNLLLDFSPVEVEVLMHYDDRSRAIWLRELPNTRFEGVTIYGGRRWL